MRVVGEPPSPVDTGSIEPLSNGMEIDNQTTEPIDVDAVRSFLKKLFVVKSPLIPTEYDFFNHVAYYSEKRRREKSLLSTNLKNAFPEASDKDLKELFGDLNEK